MNIYSFLFISIIATIIKNTNSVEYPINCLSNYVCLKCSDQLLGINGDSYCLKCNEENGFIGVAGTCIYKHNFPSELLIKNCDSYSYNLEFCAICSGDEYIDITASCHGSSKKKLSNGWILLICILVGSFIIGLSLMIALIVKYGDQKVEEEKEKEKEEEKEEEKEDVPPPPNQVVEEEKIEFYICDKYNCSKIGCKEKAVIKSNCDCGYLCLNHANVFYNNNKFNLYKKQKHLILNEHNCKECGGGVISLVKKVMKCEECGLFDFLEKIQGKEICVECKNKLDNQQ